VGKQSRIDRIRETVAGWLFLLAGVHSSYDVWLDDAPPRHAQEKGEVGP